MLHGSLDSEFKDKAKGLEGLDRRADARQAWERAKGGSGAASRLAGDQSPKRVALIAVSVLCNLPLSCWGFSRHLSGPGTNRSLERTCILFLSVLGDKQPRYSIPAGPENNLAWAGTIRSHQAHGLDAVRVREPLPLPMG